MGTIQSAINQTLATAGIAMKLNPELVKKGDINRTKAAIENLEKQEYDVMEPMGKVTEGTEAAMKDFLDQNLILRKKMYDLDSSQENYKELKSAHEAISRIEELKQDEIEEKRIQAQRQAQKRAEAKALQKKEAEAYMKQLKEYKIY